jgi:hypothetical protein
MIFSCFANLPQILKVHFVGFENAAPYFLFLQKQAEVRPYITLLLQRELMVNTP